MTTAIVAKRSVKRFTSPSTSPKEAVLDATKLCKAVRARVCTKHNFLDKSRAWARSRQSSSPTRDSENEELQQRVMAVIVAVETNASRISLGRVKLFESSSTEISSRLP